MCERNNSAEPTVSAGGGQEVLPAPERRPWSRPWWGRLCPCSHGADHKGRTMAAWHRLPCDSGLGSAPARCHSAVLSLATPPSPDCSVPWDTQLLMVEHSRVPAAQLLYRAVDKHLLCTTHPHHYAFFLGTVLLLALRSKNELHPKFPAYTKKKNEKLAHGCAQVPARDGLWAERAFLHRRALVWAGFLQLVKHFHPL